jgi:hypothetical protein
LKISKLIITAKSSDSFFFLFDYGTHSAASNP